MNRSDSLFFVENWRIIFLQDNGCIWGTSFRCNIKNKEKERATGCRNYIQTYIHQILPHGIFGTQDSFHNTGPNIWRLSGNPLI